MENQQISTTSEETMFCPSCGKSILRKSAFCPECGAKNALASTTIEAEVPSVEQPSDTASAPTQSAAITTVDAPAQPVPAETEVRVPCAKCGALLSPKMTFCSVCGKKVKSKKTAPAKKAIIIAIIAVAVVFALLIGGLAVALLVGGNNSGGSSGGSALSGKPSIEDKLESAYDTHCSSTFATLGADGSYLEIDTNPNNIDDYINTEAYRAVEKVNNYLGLPSYLFNDMGKTTALMGRQSETFEDLDLTVSWTYHPDNGLEITYKVIK